MVYVCTYICISVPIPVAARYKAWDWGFQSHWGLGCLSVCCECRVLSGRSLCVGLITLPEESNRLVCLSVIVRGGSGQLDAVASSKYKYFCIPNVCDCVYTCIFLLNVSNLTIIFQTDVFWSRVGLYYGRCFLSTDSCDLLRSVRHLKSFNFFKTHLPSRLTCR